jgi:[ribosomal protein S5]-alanine N-acetyltransferase
MRQPSSTGMAVQASVLLLAVERRLRGTDSDIPILDVKARNPGCTQCTLEGRCSRAMLNYMKKFARVQYHYPATVEYEHNQLFDSCCVEGFAGRSSLLAPSVFPVFMYQKMHLPPFEIFPLLADSTIVLRHIEPSDLHAVLPICYYDAVPARTVEEAANIQERIAQDYEEGNTVHWGIEDRLLCRIVGTCGYYRGFVGGSGELGCVLLEQFRGRGYMTAAMRLAIHFGFRTIGLNRVTAITSRENLRAIRLLERLGFTHIQHTHGEQLAYELLNRT